MECLLYKYILKNKESCNNVELHSKFTLHISKTVIRLICTSPPCLTLGGLFCTKVPCALYPIPFHGFLPRKLGICSCQQIFWSFRMQVTKLQISVFLSSSGFPEASGIFMQMNTSSFQDFGKASFISGLFSPSTVIGSVAYIGTNKRGFMSPWAEPGMCAPRYLNTEEEGMLLNGSYSTQRLAALGIPLTWANSESQG